MLHIDSLLQSNTTDEIWKIYAADSQGDSVVSHKKDGNHVSAEVFSADQTRRLIENCLLSGYSLTRL